MFKETPANRRKRGPTDERWRNSGGAKGSRTLPAGSDDQIRRRYGRITPGAGLPPTGAAGPPGVFYRYHVRRTVWLVEHWLVEHGRLLKFFAQEYSLLEGGGGGEDRTCLLFHVIPPSDGPLSSAGHVPTRHTRRTADAGTTQAGANGGVQLAPHGRCQITHGSRELQPQEIARMLEDESFNPGPRPSVFDIGATCWVFKEGGSSRKKRGVHDDRWRNSGGETSKKKKKNRF